MSCSLCYGVRLERHRRVEVQPESCGLVELAQIALGASCQIHSELEVIIITVIIIISIYKILVPLLCFSYDLSNNSVLMWRSVIYSFEN